MFNLSLFRIVQLLTVATIFFILPANNAYSQKHLISIAELEKLDETAFEKWLATNNSLNKENDERALIEFREKLTVRGETAAKEGVFEDAINFYSKARIIARKIKLANLSGINSKQIGLAYERLQNYAEAEKNYAVAVAELEGAGDNPGAVCSAGEASRNRGRNLLFQNKISEGIDLIYQSYQTGRTHAPSHLDCRILTAAALFSLGHAYHYSKSPLRSVVFFKKAINAFDEFSVEVRKTKLQSFYIDTALYSHNPLLILGRVAQARDKLATAESLIKTTGDFFQKNVLVLNQADFAAAIGDSDAAIRYLRAAHNLAVLKKNQSEQARLLVKIGYLLLNDEAYAEAEKNFSAAWLLALDKFPKYEFDAAIGKAVIAASRSNLSESTNFFEAANQLLQTKLNNFAPQKIRFLSWQLKAWFASRQYNKAEVTVDELIQLLRKIGDQSALSSLETIRAQLKFLKKDFAAARASAANAIEIIESDRLSLAEAAESLQYFNFSGTPYQILAELENIDGQFSKSLEVADKLKGRWLRDKITAAPQPEAPVLDSKTEDELQTLYLKSLANPADQILSEQIEQAESKFNVKPNPVEISPVGVHQSDEQVMESTDALAETAIISYFFTNDHLWAYVWQKGSRIKALKLTVSESEAALLTEQIAKKIDIRRNLYTWRDAKDLYEKFLAAPLETFSKQPKHLIIIQDKSLWKLPFQAMSSDGKKYLIENMTISYAPSISILLMQLKQPVIERRTIEVFANAEYQGKILPYVNAEAGDIAKMYGAKPLLNATAEAFYAVSDKSDIAHFSMHGEIERAAPLKSFLAFRPTKNNLSGQVTVNDLLNAKLKRGSLAFIASCQTDNVVTGEGLVSLAWGMTAAGASSVVSAQWEISDEATGVFTKAFYRHYKNNIPAAEAMQKAAVEMIQEKKTADSDNPFYWAAFNLSGDFR